MKKFLFTVFSILPFIVFSQTRVLVQNEPSNSATSCVVSVKWYTAKLIYPKGVNIYRRVTGTTEWEKLTAEPLKKMKEISREEIAKDSSLLFFTEFIKETKPEQLKGLMMINIYAKTFVSPAFSRFCGIQYDDKTAQCGTQYEYKVSQITDAGEKEIGITPVIKAGLFVPIESPVDYSVKAGEKKANMNWKVEETRYYGVNIYRRSSVQPAVIKITDNPIMMSKYKDSLGVMKYPDIKYTDDSLTENVTYYYYSKAVDFFGEESSPTKEIEVLIKDVTKPAPPFDLDRKIKNQKVTLTWKNPSTKDWVGLNMYRSDGVDSQYVKINKQLMNVAETLYVDSVPSPGYYYYYVATADKAGNEGNSFKTFADVADIFPPAKITGLKAVSDTGRIILTWQAGKEKDLAGYQLYRKSGNSDDENYALMNAEPIKDTRFIDTLAKNIKTSLCYKIVGVDTAMNRGVYSDAVCAKMPDILPPVQPYIKNISIRNNQIIVEWIPNKEEDLMGYNLFRCQLIDSNLSQQKINDKMIPFNLSSFSDSSAQSGIKYFYFLIAYDSTMNQSMRSELYSATLNSGGEDKLEKVECKISSKRKAVIIKWKKVKYQNASIKYIVYKDNSSGSFTPITGMLDALKYKDTSVEKGTLCKYQVRAYSEETGLIAKSEEKEIKMK